MSYKLLATFLNMTYNYTVTLLLSMGDRIYCMGIVLNFVKLADVADVSKIRL